jgi:hypothetical protein
METGVESKDYVDPELPVSPFRWLYNSKDIHTYIDSAWAAFGHALGFLEAKALNEDKSLQLFIVRDVAVWDARGRKDLQYHRVRLCASMCMCICVCACRSVRFSCQNQIPLRQTLPGMHDTFAIWPCRVCILLFLIMGTATLYEEVLLPL